MSGGGNGAPSGELSNALRRRIIFALHQAFACAAGCGNGYGLRKHELDSLHSAIDSIEENLAGASFVLLRPEVRESIASGARAREIAEKAEAARHDGDYLHFKFKLTPWPGWKGDKNLRAETEALYMPEP